MASIFTRACFCHSPHNDWGIRNWRKTPGHNLEEVKRLEILPKFMVCHFFDTPYCYILLAFQFTKTDLSLFKFHVAALLPHAA